MSGSLIRGNRHLPPFRCMHETQQYRDYGFKDVAASHIHKHFLPPLFALSGDLLKPGARLLDVGCGNGFTAGAFMERGCEVVGIDLSESALPWHAKVIRARASRSCRLIIKFCLTLHVSHSISE